MKIVEKAKSWWKYHRMVIWTGITVFPGIWVTHPEMQSLLPAKLISIVAPFVGAVGLASEWHQQVKRRAPLPTPTVPKPTEK